MFTCAFTMNNSNAWHDILFELEMSHIPPEQQNIAAISCHCPYLQQKIFKDGMKSEECSFYVSNVIC